MLLKIKRKNIFGLLFVWSIWLLNVLPVMSQNLVRQADKEYGLFNYIQAISLYHTAYKQDSNLHVANRLAECYELIQNYPQAAHWAGVVANMEEHQPHHLLRYAQMLQNNASYTEAKAQYQKYIKLAGDVSEKRQALWLGSCDSAMHWMQHPQHIRIENQPQLNSAQSDWGATRMGNRVTFISDRGRVADTAQVRVSRPFLRFDAGRRPSQQVYGWTGHSYFRLYEQNGGNDPAMVNVPFGTNYHVGPVSFVGTEMYFAVTQIPDKPLFVKGKLATVNVELYSSFRNNDGKWASPKAFAYNDVNKHSVSDPCLSKDGQVLYFSSTMPGGKGGADLYFCMRDANGNWGAPQNLAALNTEGDERTPFLAEDGSLYFSSDGLIGMGGLDIFRSVAHMGSWGIPKNMGYPLNSPRDDFAYTTYGDGEGYLSSNRAGGMGNDDIYAFKKPEPVVYTLEGIARDKKTGKPLAHASIVLSGAGAAPTTVRTAVDGRYQFKLNVDSDYSLRGDKRGYLCNIAKVSTRGLSVSTVLHRNLLLEPIVMNKGIRIENIYYDFDKSAIRPDAAIELDKIVKILIDNPNIWIELGSHTDSRGKDQYNQWLSQSRANSAVQYIIDKGIAKERITAKGYGESQLVNRCANGVKCSEADHQLNRRTEFKIVKQ